MWDGSVVTSVFCAGGMNESCLLFVVLFFAVPNGYYIIYYYYRNSLNSVCILMFLFDKTLCWYWLADCSLAEMTSDKRRS